MQEQLSSTYYAIESVWTKVIEFALAYGFKIIITGILVFIGLKLIKKIVKVIHKLLEKSVLEKSLENFIASLCDIVIKVLFILFLIEFLGFDLTTFITIIGAAGLAIGLALQGSLANFAGGILILFLSPFKVGDYIHEDATGHEGYIEVIDIFYTTLRTLDNRTVIIPNGILSNNTITNDTRKGIRRVDIEFGAGYGDDIDKVRKAMLSVCLGNARVLEDPEPAVRVSGHGESSVNYMLQAYVKSQNYISVRFELIEQVKKKFDANGINIPYPQVDLHIKSSYVEK